MGRRAFISKQGGMMPPVAAVHGGDPSPDALELGDPARDSDAAGRVMETVLLLGLPEELPKQGVVKVHDWNQHPPAVPVLLSHVHRQMPLRHRRLPSAFVERPISPQTRPGKAHGRRLSRPGSDLLQAAGPPPQPGDRRARAPGRGMPGRFQPEVPSSSPENPPAEVDRSLAELEAHTRPPNENHTSTELKIYKKKKKL